MHNAFRLDGVLDYDPVTQAFVGSNPTPHTKEVNHCAHERHLDHACLCPEAWMPFTLL